MTNEEAIKLLSKDTSGFEIHILEVELKDYNKVTEKIQEACDMGVEAIEKQIPKKPIQQSTDEKTHYKCVCGKISMTVYTDGIRQGYTPNYCPTCGQKLDWSESDEQETVQEESKENCK